MNTSFSIIRQISLIDVENIIKPFGLFENTFLSQMILFNILSNKIMVREENIVFKYIN